MKTAQNKTNNYHRTSLLQAWGFSALLLLLFLLPKNLHASHIVGGEITFECLGNSQYRIILDVYRDCFYGDPAAYFDNPAHIGVFNSSNILVQTINIPFTGMDDTLSAIFSDPCLFDPGDVCVHTTRYEKVVTLPTIPGGYQLVYQRCCRNQTISNIYNPDQTGMTIVTYMSEQSMLECNNSPDFTFIPPIFICVNKPIDFDHSAIDAEGDSLVYKLCTPYEGATYNNPYPPIPSAPPYDTVVWIDPPYNLDNILGTDSTVLAIDPHTGFMTGVPTNQGQYVVAVCVEEYRNGQLISSMRRDFQYNVGQCGEATAAFFAPHAQCENLTVEFENQSSSFTSNYLWYFQYPDTTIFSTETSPTYTYPDTGQYTIMLIADPGAICADTFFQDIYLQYNSLFVDFDVQVFDCSDSSVLSLFDLSYDTISAPVAWNWTVTYDTFTLTSNEQNPQFFLPNPVSGTIEVEVTSANNCVQLLSQNFETGIDFPGAFISDTLHICLGDSVALNPAADTIGSLPYLWTPTNLVADSTAANPIVAPTTTTTYTVHITSPGGFCTFVKDVTVVVEPLPQLDFDTYIQCDAVTVEFTNTSQNASAFIWDFGDPNTNNDTSTETNPTYTYPAIGTYTVNLMTDTSLLCRDTLTRDITLPERILQAEFNYQVADCEEDHVTLSFSDASLNNTGNIVQWDWTFSTASGTQTASGQNVEITLYQNQNLQVQLLITTDLGCQDSISQNINIDLIQENIAPYHHICLGESVELNPNFNSGYAYLWTPSDGIIGQETLPNPVAMPSQTTTYTVSIFKPGDTPCTIQRQVTVEVETILAQVDFSYHITCDGLTVEFTNLSSNTFGYVWDFGDPTTTNDVSTEENPSYTYPAIGTYTVTLMSDASNFCGDTISMDITIPQIELQAGFTYETAACETDFQTLQFYDATFNTTLGDVVAWNWQFGNFASSNEQNPSITVNQSQSFDVTLTVTTNEGCQNSYTETVTVELITVNVPDSTLLCPGDTLTLNPGGPPQFNYQWSPASEIIGDPTAPSVQVAPTQTTTYTLTVTQIGNDTCSITRSITVFVPPAIGLSASEDILTCDSSVTLEAQTSELAGLAWNENGQPIIPSPGNSFEVPVSGITTYEVIATDIYGCTESDTILVSGGPVDVALTPDQYICTGEPIVVMATNQDPNDILQYQWTIEGAGTLMNEDQPTPIIGSPPGTSTVIGTFTNQFGCSQTDSIFIAVVDSDISLGFTYEVLCDGVTVEFTNTSTNAYDFVWDFGVPGTNTDTSTAINPTFTFPGLGTYPVTLNIAYEVDCAVPVTIPIDIVEPIMVADFTYAYADCQEDSILISFTDQSTSTLTSPINQWMWTFSNGQSSTEQNPVITVTPGDSPLTVHLTVITEIGCMGETAQSLNFTFTEVFLPDTLVLCLGDTTQLNPGANPDYDYLWTPATGLSDPTAGSPLAFPTETTTYTLDITNYDGADTCMLQKSITVFVPDQIQLSIAPGDTALTCDAPVLLTANVDQNVSYSWTDQNGNVIGTNQDVVVLPDSTATYYLQVENQYSCTAEDEVFVINGHIDVQVEEQIITCPTDSLQLSVINLDDFDQLDILWTAGPGGSILSDPTDFQPWVTTDPGNVSFNYTLSNQFDCEENGTVEVFTSDFSALLQDTVEACPGIGTPLNPDGNPTYNYSWEPATGLDDSSSYNPTATLWDDQIYTVFIGYDDGLVFCADTLQTVVLVNPDIELTAAPDTILCDTTEITLTAEAASPVSFSWYDNWPSNTPFATGASTQVTPLGTAQYYVLATDSLGCMDTAMVTIEAYPLALNLTEYTDLCLYEAATLEVLNADPTQMLDFQWAPDSLVTPPSGSAAVSVAPSGDTQISVIVTNQYGCTDTLYSFINVIDVYTGLFAEAEPDTLFANSGETSQLSTVNNPDYIYYWDPEFTLTDPTIYNPVASPEETTTYTVIVEGEAGCQAEAEVTVYVLTPDCAEPVIFVPSSFSPNGDGKNDILFVYGNNQANYFFDEFYFTIYDRWGQMLFESTDPDQGWDGTFKGELLPPDVYGYYLRVKCYNGQEFFKKGNVTLLR